MSAARPDGRKPYGSQPEYLIGVLQKLPHGGAGQGVWHARVSEGPPVGHVSLLRGATLGGKRLCEACCAEMHMRDANNSTGDIQALMAA